MLHHLHSSSVGREYCQSPGNGLESYRLGFIALFIWYPNQIKWSIYIGKEAYLNVRQQFEAAREAAFLGKHQHYFLDVIGAQSSAIADVYEHEGSEGIGEITRYTIRFTHPSHDLSPREYIGKRGSFLIQ